MVPPRTVRIEFYSAFDMLDFVQVVSDHVGKMAGLDEDELHWVSVAVRESGVRGSSPKKSPTRWRRRTSSSRAAAASS